MAPQQRLPYEGMIAETVSFPGHNGDLIGGYMARPLGPGPYPGVIVIHEIFGLITHTKELARKFTAAGYIAIAPDLYSREAAIDPVDPRAVTQRMGGLPDARAIGDMEGAAAVLMASPQCNGKIGVIGHCSGGRWTLLFACNSKSVSAAVDCYGGRVVASQEELTPAMPVPVVDMIVRLSCPLLGIFGIEDQNPSPAHVARLEEELKKQGKVYEFHTYQNAGHGIFADYRPSYRQEAATDGWEKIFAFFGRHLTG